MITMDFPLFFINDHKFNNKVVLHNQPVITTRYFIPLLAKEGNRWKHWRTLSGLQVGDPKPHLAWRYKSAANWKNSSIYWFLHCTKKKGIYSWTSIQRAPWGRREKSMDRRMVAIKGPGRCGEVAASILEWKKKK